MLDGRVALIMTPERCCKVVKKLALAGGLFFACDSGVMGARRIRDSFLLPHEKAQEARHEIFESGACALEGETLG